MEVIRNENLRFESGNFNSDDPLVGFLYLLMRDHILCGDIESIMKVIEGSKSNSVEYTNGYLAKYAENISNRLRNEKV